MFGTLTQYMGVQVKHYRIETGQQGDAPLGHRLQPEEVLEIYQKTFKEQGKDPLLI